jgi:hypothetical protein
MTTFVVPTEALTVHGPPQMFGELDTAYLDYLSSLPIPVAELFAGAPDTTL